MTATSIPAGDGQQEAMGPYVEEPELARGLASLRRRTGMVPTEKWLAVAGGVLMPLGVLLVIAGWFGAAHTTRLFEEIPYLISGGLLGVALATIGALTLFAHWLTVLIREGRRQETLRKQDHVELMEALALLTSTLDRKEDASNGRARSAQPERAVRRAPRRS